MSVGGISHPRRHALLNALDHMNALTEAIVAGDIIIANATPKWSRLAKGTDGKFLKMVSSLPSWQSIVELAAHDKTYHTGSIIPDAAQDFQDNKVYGLKLFSDAPSAEDLGTNGIGLMDRETMVWDEYTKLLLHCNGADESTTIIDEMGKSVTAVGNAQLDTAQKKFGTASVLFDGVGDYLSTPTSTDFDFGIGPWTVDFWVRRDGNQAYYAGIIGAAKQAGLLGWVITWGYDAGSVNKVRLVSKASGSWAQDILSSTTISDATQTHVAVVRYGNTVTMYFGGVSVGSVDCTGYTYNSGGSGLCLGREYTDADGWYHKGWLDEIRVSKGVARWTEAFDPPTEEYTEGVQTHLRRLYANIDGEVVAFAHEEP